ncbi:hypothetical protein U1Q18_050001, partial [Sarracenia purpurea var. burkii]
RVIFSKAASSRGWRRCFSNPAPFGFFSITGVASAISALRKFSSRNYSRRTRESLVIKMKGDGGMVVEMAEFGVMVKAGFNLRWQGKYNGYGFSSILSSVVRPINKTERFIGVAGGGGDRRVWYRSISLFGLCMYSSSVYLFMAYGLDNGCVYSSMYVMYSVYVPC